MSGSYGTVHLYEEASHHGGQAGLDTIVYCSYTDRGGREGEGREGRREVGR